MSYTATSMAWKLELKGMTKLVLLFLADKHNDGTGKSWFSYSVMAKHCGISRRSAIEHCAKLEGIGLLKISRRRDADKNINKTNEFRLNFRVNISAAGQDITMLYGDKDDNGGAGAALGVVQEIHQGGAGAAPKPIREPITIEPVNKIHVASATFETLWSDLSKIWKDSKSPIGGKKPAIAAMSKQSLTDQQKTTLVDAARQHALAVSKGKSSGSKINLPNVSTWINQKRFEQPSSDFYTVSSGGGNHDAQINTNHNFDGRDWGSNNGQFT